MVTIHNSFKDSRFVRLSFGDLPGDALIGGAASIISAGIGAGASRSAAKKYLQGVRETNAMNLQLAREQRDWDLAQWNRENEYNSAAAQMKRWQEAGMSPQSFANVGSPGEAAALQSPDMANQVAPGDLSGYASSFAQSIQSGIKGALDWKQMKINQDQLNLDKERLANQTKETQSVVDLNKALTQESQKRLDLIGKQADLTEEQKWKVRAELDLAVQAWEQAEKLFPLKYKGKEIENASSDLDRAFKDKTMQERIRSFALQNNKSIRETELLIKQAYYWLMQGKEGEFNVSTQPLRFDILNWNQQQLKFNLDFDKNTRYFQWKFDNIMKGIHAFSEVGHLVVDAFEVFSPGKHIHNYIFNPSGNLP